MNILILKSMCVHMFYFDTLQSSKKLNKKKYFIVKKRKSYFEKKSNGDYFLIKLLEWPESLY